MKNLMKFSKLLFLATVLIFTSCSQQDELLIDPNSEIQNVEASEKFELSARASCDLSNYKAINGKTLGVNGMSGSSKERKAYYKLAQSRKAVAFYRAYARAYSDYFVRKKSNSSARIDRSSLNRIGLRVFSSAYSEIIRTAKTCYNNRIFPNDSERVKRTKKANVWRAVKSYLNAMKRKNYNGTIRDKSNGWDGSESSHGSYTIAFENNKVYLGKGANKYRMRGSAREHCGDKPYRGDFQGTSASNYVKQGVPKRTDSRQAYKEEAVKMYWHGFVSTQSTGNTLNKSRTKGERYITEDGF